MSDLIERQDAIKAIEDLQDCYNGFSDTYDKACIIGALEEVPSAQTERKKGEWIWCGNHHICSECDEWALTRWDEDKCDEVDILTDYCPNCGADMRGEQDGRFNQ